MLRNYTIHIQRCMTLAGSKTEHVGKMGSSDMMDTDIIALFPGNWLIDKVQINQLSRLQ